MSVGPAIPNALTMSRILIAPLVVLALLGSADLAALSLFAVGMATDVLDGHFARSRGWSTTFGKLMDPIADKMLVGGAFVALAATNSIAAWAVAIILGRELAVSGLRMLALRRGVVIPADRFGKAKTGLQVLTVIVLLLIPDPTAPAIVALVLLTVLVTLISGLGYLRAYMTRENPRAPLVVGGPVHQ